MVKFLEEKTMEWTLVELYFMHSEGIFIRFQNPSVCLDQQPFVEGPIFQTSSEKMERPLVALYFIYSM